MRTHVMVDIESLGKGHNALVATIGAVAFDPEGSGPFDGENARFYRRIDLRNAEKAGCRADVDTMLWWMEQDPTARVEALGPGQRVGLRHALFDFSKWFSDPAHGGDVAIWANAPTFDLSILRDAFALVGLNVPWGFRAERDMRTVCREILKGENVPVVDATPFPPHHALGDAVRQVYVVQAALKRARA